jgi:hypothetical protein
MVYSNTWDMELSNGTQLCEANAELTRHLERIVLRAGSMESKWLVIRGSLYEKITYFAKFMTWPLLWYLQLDKVVSKALRRISKTCLASQRSFSRYIETTEAWVFLGFPRLYSCGSCR